MKKVMFICHGNICRSPMGEMILKHMLRERGREQEFVVASAATSTEEIGNPIYPPARAELARNGILVEKRRARQVTKGEYADWDVFLCMDHYNVRNLHRIFGSDPEGKIHLLMDYTSRPGEVSDPWYSDRFDIAFRDIWEGCEGVLKQMK